MIFKFKLLIILLVVLCVSTKLIAAQTDQEWNSAISKLPLSPTARLSSISPTAAVAKSYYLGVHFRLNWFEAHLYCRRYDMQLVTLANKQQNDAIIKYLYNNGLPLGRFWSSGVDLNEEGRFYWMSTGQLINYTNWAVGEPNNGSGGREHCVELFSAVPNKYAWNDRQCGDRLHFICEQ